MKQEVRQTMAALWEALWAPPMVLNVKGPVLSAMDAAMRDAGITAKDVADLIRAPEPVVVADPVLAIDGVPMTATEVKQRWDGQPYVASPPAQFPEGCTTEHEAACHVALLLGQIVGSSMKPGARPLKTNERDFLTSIHKRVTGTPARYVTTKQMQWLDRLANSYGLTPIKLEPYF